MFFFHIKKTLSPILLECPPLLTQPAIFECSRWPSVRWFQQRSNSHQSGMPSEVVCSASRNHLSLNTLARWALLLYCSIRNSYSLVKFSIKQLYINTSSSQYYVVTEKISYIYYTYTMSCNIYSWNNVAWVTVTFKLSHIWWASVHCTFSISRVQTYQKSQYLGFHLSSDIYLHCRDSLNKT